MGLFDMFKKAPAKPADITVDAAPGVVYAAANGTGMAMADIPDPVFASGAMGQAFGIKPTEGVIYAPVSGTITATTPTLHALGLAADDGTEVLIHVGVDTVEMKGDGFEGFVKQGDAVKAGQALMTFDLAKIAKAGYSDVVITVITNSDDFASITAVEPGAISAGAKVFDLAK